MTDVTVPNTEAVLLLAHACIAEGQRRLKAQLPPDYRSSDEKQEQDSHANAVVMAHSASDKKEKDDDTVLVPMDLRPAEEGGAQHLSLSRTLYLRSHHIDPFVADLRKALSWATRWVGFGVCVYMCERDVVGDGECFVCTCMC